MARAPREKTKIHFIKEWLTERGLKQESLSALMDANPSTVSKIIRGTQSLTDEWVVRFANALEIEIVDIFRHPTDEAIEPRLNEDDQFLWTEFVGRLRRLDNATAAKFLKVQISSLDLYDTTPKSEKRKRANG